MSVPSPLSLEDLPSSVARALRLGGLIALQASRAFFRSPTLEEHAADGIWVAELAFTLSRPVDAEGRRAWQSALHHSASWGWRAVHSTRTREIGDAVDVAAAGALERVLDASVAAISGDGAKAIRLIHEAKDLLSVVLRAAPELARRDWEDAMRVWGDLPLHEWLRTSRERARSEGGWFELAAEVQARVTRDLAIDGAQDIDLRLEEIRAEVRRAWTENERVAVHAPRGAGSGAPPPPGAYAAPPIPGGFGAPPSPSPPPRGFGPTHVPGGLGPPPARDPSSPSPAQGGPPAVAPAQAQPAPAPERPPPAPAVRKDAQFTVYRPASIVPGAWYPLLVFAHPGGAAPGHPDPLAEVERQAGIALRGQPDAYGKLVQDASRALPVRAQLRFVPDVPGVEFNPPERAFAWIKDIHREEIELCADAGAHAGDVLRGALRVFYGRILVAEIPLALQVGEASEPRAAPSFAPPVLATLYRNVFVSYSHRDRDVVDEVLEAAKTLGDRFLQDCVDLRSGEAWSDGLARLIEQSNVFQLFWSTNAMQSRFVEREWTYALGLHRPDFVRPTYWEEPMPAPPSQLEAVHFACYRPRERVHAAKTDVARDVLAGLPSPSMAPQSAPRAARSRAAHVAILVGGLAIVLAIVLAALLLLR